MNPTPPSTTLSGHRILITGGAGFIATHLAQALAPHNQLVLFDTGFEGRALSFTELGRRDNVTLLSGDVMDPAQVAKAAQGCDTIVHMAAIVGVQEVLRQPKKTMEVNFIGTRNVLEAVAKPSSLHRFVYFSTSEVFGGMSFRVEEHHSTSFGHVAEARWSYSIAKLAGEHLTFAYRREEGLPAVIVRPFNVFGPLRTGDHAVLQFVIRALRNEPIEIHGDGSQVRSWCYVDDFVDAILRVLERPEAVGEDFNIGNAQNTCTILDLAQRIVALVGAKSEIRFIHPNFADIDLRIPRPRKAMELLQFKPQWDLGRALEATAAWYRENQQRIVLKNQTRSG
jgi:nucleoside-diphosphate-sugar epimerase